MAICSLALATARCNPSVLECPLATSPAKSEDGPAGDARITGYAPNGSGGRHD